MTLSYYPTRAAAAAALACALAAGAGCHSVLGGRGQDIQPADVPRELAKVLLPDYRVEPPDILTVDAIRATPKPPYVVQPLDVLFVQLPAPLPNEEARSGNLAVDADGTIDLGFEYGGPVQVAGLTVAQIREAIAQQVTKATERKDPLKPAQVTVSLVQSQASQRIGGPHLVRPDGTISLSTYGSVRVAGLTLPEVRRAVEAKLAEYLQDPIVAVDVQNYNSKLIYVIFDGLGAGQTVYRLPVTGNDTVLDVIAQVNGMTAASDHNRVWVSRPAPAGQGPSILPVDWRAVTECGDTATNYQLMPGDRLFVGANPAQGIDARLARLFAPAERVFGITLLGTSLYRNIAFVSGGIRRNRGATGLGLGGLGGF
ncbi:MAG: polysaccharide biosynthesis/export family protein [Gemmataceae bacterium]|nr:polysaccharide biosynthesis/export family protein [Gemmataceae bacterium]